MAGQSYHIYIHGDGVGSGSSPTKPKKTSKPTKPKQDDDGIDLTGVVKQVGGFIQNPDSLIGMAKSAAFAKAGIVGVIAKVGYDISMKITSEVVDLQALMTGDISGQIGLNNFRAGLNMVFTPISSAISYAKYNIQLQQQVERSKLQQQLLGDSVINQNYNRKV